MRALVVLMLLAGTAGAAPVVTKCYAGTGLVFELELDRDKHEIREHRWRDPLNEAVIASHVAADGKTLTWERGPIKGTGTLEGPAWKWTAIHREVEINGEKVSSDFRLAGDASMKPFDCKDLNKQIAALDDTAADAKHACYAGTSDEGQRVVVDQITEDSRVQIVVTYGTHTNKVVMSIEGAKIFVKNPDRSWTATGTITGKPGAWTGYEYTVTIGNIDLRTEGSLGGPQYSAKTTAQTGGTTSHLGIVATAFDCKDLAAKRAALK